MWSSDGAPFAPPLSCLLWAVCNKFSHFRQKHSWLPRSTVKGMYPHGRPKISENVSLLLRKFRKATRHPKISERRHPEKLRENRRVRREFVDAHERAETPTSPAAAHMPVSCVSLCAVLLAGPSSVVAMLAHARGPLRPSPWAARTYRAKMSAGVAVPETFFWDGKLHCSGTQTAR